MPIPLFFIGCIIESYIYLYLVRWAKNNMLPAMIYHCASNLFINMFYINPSQNDGNIMPYSLMILIQFIIVIVIIFWDKRKNTIIARRTNK